MFDVPYTILEPKEATIDVSRTLYSTGDEDVVREIAEMVLTGDVSGVVDAHHSSSVR